MNVGWIDWDRSFWWRHFRMPQEYPHQKQNNGKIKCIKLYVKIDPHIFSFVGVFARQLTKYLLNIAWDFSCFDRMKAPIEQICFLTLNHIAVLLSMPNVFQIIIFIDLQVIRSTDSGDWTLQIKFSQARDSGIYECQVNTEPKMSMGFRLNIVGKCADVNVHFVWLRMHLKGFIGSEFHFWK